MPIRCTINVSWCKIKIQTKFSKAMRLKPTQVCVRNLQHVLVQPVRCFHKSFSHCEWIVFFWRCTVFDLQQAWHLIALPKRSVLSYQTLNHAPAGFSLPHAQLLRRCHDILYQWLSICIQRTSVMQYNHWSKPLHWAHGGLPLSPISLLAQLCF